jgi:mediator of RNA polymerase II transcription subunit 5
MITASFDVVANAINRTEPEASINIYRSYLANKLPVLLSSYSGMLFPPATMESCITGAMQRMDPSTDPYATQSFDLLSSSGMLSDARQDFLFACALHDLIPETSIETILGDVPMQSLPESGRYSRSTLVTQCTQSSSRVEELVRELEKLEGNSAEVAAALVEVRRVV